VRHTPLWAFCFLGTALLFADFRCSKGTKTWSCAATVLLVVLGLSMEVTAGEYTGACMHCRPASTSQRYTASAAEQYARSNGATDADIVARRCIALESTQSASAQLVR
jgi:hypothetical protein